MRNRMRVIIKMIMKRGNLFMISKKMKSVVLLKIKNIILFVF